MKIAEIHFNHTPDTGSIPLRHAPGFEGRGQQVEIAAPEWRDGVSQPVAFARDAVTGPITIKAKFIKGPPNTRVMVRAISPFEPRLRETGPVPITTAFGDVRPQMVAFDGNGESGLQPFELSGDIRRSPIGSVQIVWDWQVHTEGDRWSYVSKTYHVVCVSPHVPTNPWLKSTTHVVKNLWWEAMIVALHWADGASTDRDIIEKIAMAINEHPLLYYDAGSTPLVAVDDVYQLSFLLKQFDLGASVTTDCVGVASTLVTFANALGLDLKLLELRPTGLTLATVKFRTNPIRILRSPNWVQERWGKHEVALNGASPVCDNAGNLAPAAKLVDGQTLSGLEGHKLVIYDANLHVNQPVELLPIEMRLGTAGSGDLQYRDLLIGSGDAPLVTPKPAKSIC
jgi:hypothetical protein